MNKRALSCRYGKRDKLSKLPGWITHDMSGDMLNMSIIEASVLAKRFFREMALPSSTKTVELDVSKLLWGAASEPAESTSGFSDMPAAAAAVDVAAAARIDDVGSALIEDDELVSPEPLLVITPAVDADEAVDVGKPWTVRDLMVPPPLKRLRFGVASE